MASSPAERMQEHMQQMRVSHLGRQTNHLIDLAGQLNYYEELVPALQQRIRELEAQVQFLTPPAKAPRRRRAPVELTHPEARNGG